MINPGRVYADAPAPLEEALLLMRRSSERYVEALHTLAPPADAMPEREYLLRVAAMHDRTALMKQADARWTREADETAADLTRYDREHGTGSGGFLGADTPRPREYVRQEYAAWAAAPTPKEGTT